MGLEEIANELCNFRVLSLKNYKKFGEPILYGE